ncbi:Protein kinase-like (PK-like) [Glarea lozoyensis ATCC 20868]|uniref:Protein kinase-like (PK-like) n=1 Tax=Glarea lozoyensis (strain ATCC 20868 / MF5171) TaxID=1116229 RepID=S3D508_GLAL2|nr:Protein kinase-like (PK-like) [Glarea lozoyensis ATCC 20868]EPE32179.1 Protein kinase-like (PK-like) [Glarea lozoyensis ATCC 20868]
MASLFGAGQLLRGKVNRYTITKQIHECLWLAMTASDQTVVIKSVRHFRLDTERVALKRFQSRSSVIRPLIDEIEDPSDPPALVLKHLDDDLFNAAAAKRLTTSEIKLVAKRVLEGLNVIHEDGYVHTDIKLDNILVNYAQGSSRFAEIQLTDLGNTVRADSKWAKECDMIGAPVWRSPEAQLQIGWGSPTDIRSFGTVRDNWLIFKPHVPFGHDHYEIKIVMKNHQFFGPFPLRYRELVDEEMLEVITYIMNGVPLETMKPFRRVGEKEISKEDKEFVCRVMKMDPRDRPTAKELLEDEWFEGVE